MAVDDGWQVVLPDDTGLSGQRLAEIVRWLVERTGANWAVVASVDGAGPSIGELLSAECSSRVFPVEELLRLAGGVLQFDWGDFFLCTSRASADSISSDDDYAHSVARAVATVRAVDDEDFFLYGTSERLLEEIREQFPNGDVRTAPLDRLEFPE